MELHITPVDHKAQEDGTWAFYRGVRLLIARNNNPRFKASFRRLSKPYERDLEKGTLPEETSEHILCRSMAEGILVGWDETTFVINGEQIEYSIDSAYNLLKNDPDCRDFINEFAGEVSNFLRTEQEELTKN